MTVRKRTYSHPHGSAAKDYPLVELGGSGPVIHLALANGFPPETYRPALEPLTDRYRVVCIPPRALWPGDHAPHMMRTWRDMAEDLRAGLNAHGLRGVIGVGHSMGAVATMLAAIADPGLFRGMILLDPTIMEPRLLRLIFTLRALGLGERFPLVVKAKRRRREFEDEQHAYDYFRGKPLFADWPDGTVRLYAEYLTRKKTDGSGVELDWSPEWEARYYRQIFTDAWRMVRQVRGLMPTLVIRGDKTDTFLASSAARFRKTFPEATMVEIAGHGHLFPQSAPNETRQIIERWLVTQVSKFVDRRESNMVD